MNPWRPIDAIADWLVHTLDARAQLRFGVLLTLASLPLWVWGAFTTEPKLVYLMSAAALTIGGISTVLTAESLEVLESQDDTDD